VHVLKGQKDLKHMEKQEQANPNTCRRREIIKIRAGNKKEIQRINETKSWFIEKINIIYTPRANLTKMRRDKSKSVKSEMQKGR
jgi:hypothetical protein